MTPFRTLPSASIPISRLGLYLPYSSYGFVIPHTTVFTAETSVDMPLCTPITLVEKYGHALPCTPILSVEIPVETSVHMLPQEPVHVLPRESLILLPCVCLSVHVIIRSSVYMPPRATVLAVAVLHVCL